MRLNPWVAAHECDGATDIRVTIEPGWIVAECNGPEIVHPVRLVFYADDPIAFGDRLAKALTVAIDEHNTNTEEE